MHLFKIIRNIIIINVTIIATATITATAAAVTTWGTVFLKKLLTV
jgi:hypothetical protein